MLLGAAQDAMQWPEISRQVTAPASWHRVPFKPTCPPGRLLIQAICTLCWLPPDSPPAQLLLDQCILHPQQPIYSNRNEDSCFSRAPSDCLKAGKLYAFGCAQLLSDINYIMACSQGTHHCTTVAK